MIEIRTGRRRARRGARQRCLATMIGLALALAVPVVARADVDLSNDWVVHFNAAPALTCDLEFVQSGSSLTVSGDCRGVLFSLASFSGTVDPQSGSFSLSGGIAFQPPLSDLPISFAGAPLGDGSELGGTATVGGQAGAFVARLCGNGNVDPGETCDDGTTIGGCCTSTCTAKPDGITCDTTQACQIAPTCSAGACVGAAKAAGTECEADGNSCTDDACDGAGACAVGACSPCCGGPACRPAPRFTSCMVPTDARNMIDIQATPFGAKDKIVWNIQHLAATAPADLPDPQTTDYAVCLYVLDADDDFSILAYDAIAPAGLGCGRARCWTQGANGVAYNGGPLRPGGVLSLRVKPGAAGKAKLSFVGRGPDLDLTTPLYIPGGELWAELHAGASCWSAPYLNFGEPPSIRTNTRYRQKGGP